MENGRGSPAEDAQYVSFPTDSKERSKKRRQQQNKKAEKSQYAAGGRQVITMPMIAVIAMTASAVILRSLLVSKIP